MPVINAMEAGGSNRCAFLDTIASSEIGASMLALTDNGYNVLVGSTPGNLLTFPSYVAHPNILNAKFDSTAAGRYQELHMNAVNYTKSLKLADFGPLSQDKIALEQIKECGALAHIDAGNFAQALALVAHIWASFPGAGYGQHENTVASLQAAYVAAGGTLAA